MTATHHQPELPLARRPAITDVPLDIVMRCRDLLAAINLCIEVSGLDDKEVHLSLGTVAAVAQRLGRKWLGCELNPAYGELIEQRVRGTLGLELTA